MKWLSILLLVFATLAAHGATLTDLRDLTSLKQQFNQDVGKVRLITLLSPT